MTVLRENFPGRYRNTIKNGAAEFTLRFAFLQKTENLAHKIMKVFLLFLLKNHFERMIDFTQGAGVNISKAGNLHDLKKKSQLGDMLMTLVGFGFFQLIRNLQIQTMEITD